MTRPGVVLAVLLVLTGQPLLAEGIGKSLIPKPRPVPAELTVASSNAPISRMPPKPRPAQLGAIKPETVVELAALAPLATSLRPRPRPEGLTAAPAAAKRKKVADLHKAAAVRTPQDKGSLLPKKGSVCGDPAIRGETMAPVVSKVKGCGIEDPVRVTSIAGVKLSQPATITCDTAIATRKWLERAVQPAFGKTPVVKLNIAGHYVCRPRNNIRGAKISEHGRGRALDISGFVLADGRQLSIAGDYRRSKAIKAAHKAACGIFGTTLGPGSDGHHEDHLHFDVARHGNGSYCR
ncbi:extensin-like domain-containing protein [Gemmobacter denitrificans]|uniref:Extensin family protein n=1 Tax=Gemmobacter denitrificans TaxID=3123040 RepID=A0ABU8BUL4_9RHOB